jgi:hypothetical protein
MRLRTAKQGTCVFVGVAVLMHAESPRFPLRFGEEAKVVFKADRKACGAESTTGDNSQLC